MKIRNVKPTIFYFSLHYFVIFILSTDKVLYNIFWHVALKITKYIPIYDV